MKESAAREGILRFFPEPPSHSTEDLGIVLRLGGRDHFLDAARVVEITGPLPVSRIPGTQGRGVSFWRGKAHEVHASAFEGVGGFVLVRGAHGDFFVASEVPPRAAFRKDLPAECENYPEDV